MNDWENLGAPAGTATYTWSLTRAPAGRTTIDIDVQIGWEYGSTYHNGGAFIRSCWVWVSKCKVEAGHDVDITCFVDPPWNIGTATAPVAALQISLTGGIATPLWYRPLRKQLKIGGNAAVNF